VCRKIVLPARLAVVPTLLGDVEEVSPADAGGPAGELRAQIPAIATGLNTERLGTPGGPVASAGDIPVEVLAHSQECLAALPTCGA
jgi:hypothetical protein